MINVLIYGAGRCFMQSVSILKQLEMIGDCKIEAVTSEDNYNSSIFEWDFINKKEIVKRRFDCIYLAINDEKDGIKEITGMGIDVDIIVPREAVFIPAFSFTNYMNLKKHRLTIIANMCWGGVTYHYFHLQFLSPFINMFMLDDDYLKMLENLNEYMQCPLTYSHMEKETFMKTEYPVFYLGNGDKRVYLHMNHYKDEKEGKVKWNERKRRMNMENLLFMMYTDNPESALIFDKLPYRKKVCFTKFPSELDSACYLDIFSRSTLKDAPDWQIVSGLAAGRYVFYNPWELLLYGTYKERWCK